MSVSSAGQGLRPGVCTSSTRPANPFTGQIVYETDTGYLRVWDGSAWDYLSQKQDTAEGLPAETYMGLVKVIPTAIAGSGVSLSANGTVTFTGSTSIAIDGIFTTQYRNYRIELTGTSNSVNASDLTIGLRASGTTNTTANYFSNIIYNTHAGGPAQSYLPSQTKGYGGQTADLIFNNSIDVFAPQIVSRTGIITNGNGFGSNTAVVGIAFVNFNATTQFDGIVFAAATATIQLTGQCVVYGYSD